MPRTAQERRKRTFVSKFTVRVDPRTEGNDFQILGLK